MIKEVEETLISTEKWLLLIIAVDIYLWKLKGISVIGFFWVLCKLGEVVCASQIESIHCWCSSLKNKS